LGFFPFLPLLFLCIHVIVYLDKPAVCGLGRCGKFGLLRVIENKFTVSRVKEDTNGEGQI